MTRAEVINADVLDGLRSLAAESVQCCVTSPPYWGLRDYGTEGQIGLEPTPEAYVSRLVDVFREVRRVLRPDGTLWLNLGDSYVGGKGMNGTTKALSTAAERGFVQSGGTVVMALRPQDRVPDGLKPKDLIGIPWRVAFALQADGWWLRSGIIWAKPNPMPESVTDRPTKAHEYLFLLTNAARYYYDRAAIAEPHMDVSIARRGRERSGGKYMDSDGGQPNANPHSITVGLDHCLHPDGRNARSVWTIATEPFPEAHFAVMPTALVEPCVKAGSKPGNTILDPFCGSGTVGVVARRLGREFIGIDLSEDYCRMARRRIENYHRERPPAMRHELPLFEGERSA